MMSIWRKSIAWALVTLLISFFVTSANAAPLTFDTDETVSLSDPAINFTILAGSGADSFTVNTGNLVAVVTPGVIFTITSASRGLSVTGQTARGDAKLECASGVATLRFRATGPTETITITPTSAACNNPPSIASGSGGGGGNGGGGNGYSSASVPAPSQPVSVASVTPTPALIANLKQQLANLLLQLQTLILNRKKSGLAISKEAEAYLASSVAGVVGVAELPTTIITKRLCLWSVDNETNKSVANLQKFLVKQGLLSMPRGVNYGYFGFLTEKAVKAFQIKEGIAKAGEAGYGCVGPNTKKRIEELRLNSSS